MNLETFKVLLLKQQSSGLTVRAFGEMRKGKCPGAQASTPAITGLRGVVLEQIGCEVRKGNCPGTQASTPAIYHCPNG